MDKKSRTYNAKRNILFGILNKIITLGFPFLIRTIMIRKLGVEYLGLSSLFASILQVLNMAELGFSSAITFSMYKPIAARDNKKVSALLCFYRKVYRVIGLSILIIGLLVMPFLSYIISGDIPDDINIYVLFFIYLINTVISYLCFAYRSVLLSVSQRQDILSNIDTIIVLGRSCIQIVTLLLFSNYYLYIVWNPIFTLVSNMLIYHVTTKTFPDYVCKGSLTRDEIRKIVVQIKGIIIGKFALVSRNSFDNIILSMFVGLKQVAIYSNYYYIMSAVLGVMTVITQSMTAGVGNSIAIETKEKNYNDFLRFNFYFSWLGAWCTICLLCIYQPFMRIWVGNEFQASFESVILFCTYFYITQMGQIRAVYASASGIWWEFRYLQICEMITNFVLNFILGYIWGMEGVLISTIISVTLFSIIGIGVKTISIYFEKESREYFVESIKFIIITILVAITTFNICRLVQGGQGLILVARGAICCLVPNFLFFIIAYSQPKYREYLLQLKQLIKIRK